VTLDDDDLLAVDVNCSPQLQQQQQQNILLGLVTLMLSASQ